MIEAIFAGPVLLAESPHRESALLLFRDQLPPEVEPRRLCLRHVASIGDLPPLAKWCSSDAYWRTAKAGRGIRTSSGTPTILATP